MTEVRLTRAGAERLAEIEPLWKALPDHHAAVAPKLGGHLARSPEEAWARRRIKYEAWLGDPDTFLLFAERAERAGRPVGYALVTLGEGPQGWPTGERLADVQTLSVVPDARGEGVGTLLWTRWSRSSRGVESTSSDCSSSPRTSRRSASTSAAASRR